MARRINRRLAMSPPRLFCRRPNGRRQNIKRYYATLPPDWSAAGGARKRLRPRRPSAAAAADKAAAPLARLGGLVALGYRRGVAPPRSGAAAPRRSPLRRLHNRPPPPYAAAAVRLARLGVGVGLRCLRAPSIGCPCLLRPSPSPSPRTAGPPSRPFGGSTICPAESYALLVGARGVYWLRRLKTPQL